MCARYSLTGSWDLHAEQLLPWYDNDASLTTTGVIRFHAVTKHFAMTLISRYNHHLNLELSQLDEEVLSREISETKQAIAA